ncbi:hypothetical protein B0T19DRAFT_291561 [Cercophora scortea]|uniref:Uncharacterized protein n=1 Tax=Cercophora scortea TaxID=314031 RepID=A0AAE0M371_9PEZI|nr:hypothetical protein B0T19DRAFT_291561 [Cercophora scortea]
MIKFQLMAPSLSLTILFLVGIVSGVELKDLFTIQPGVTHGGCDARLSVLDDWHQEAIESLDSAIQAAVKYSEKSDTGKRVRKAMFSFFKITDSPGGAASIAAAKEVENNLFEVQRWFNGFLQSSIKAADTFLFCDSDFLVLKDPAVDKALDYQGNGIIVNGNPITISQVPEYANDLKGGDVPWWSGDRTSVNGYYFTTPDSGGRFCNSKNLGLTATLSSLKQGASGAQPVGTLVQDVVMCPYAFTRRVPDSYAKASAAIKAGTSLQAAVPKSATLLHEGFHVVHGTDFLQGDSEICKQPSSNKALKY